METLPAKRKIPPTKRYTIQKVLTEFLGIPRHVIYAPRNSTRKDWKLRERLGKPSGKLSFWDRFTEWQIATMALKAHGKIRKKYHPDRVIDPELVEQYKVLSQNANEGIERVKRTLDRRGFSKTSWDALKAKYYWPTDTMSVLMDVLLNGMLLIKASDLKYHSRVISILENLQNDLPFPSRAHGMLNAAIAEIACISSESCEKCVEMEKVIARERARHQANKRERG